MIKRKIAVIAGTSEATDFINSVENKYNITAYVATEAGRDILPKFIKIKVGRLDESGFTKELRLYEAVFDLSHPFAVAVSEIVKKVCQNINIPYFRVSRGSSSYDYKKIVYVDSKEDTLKILNKNLYYKIFLTTGVNTLKFYEDNIINSKERTIARILNTEDSKKLSKNSKLKLIYSMPPFSIEDNNNIICQYNISIVVTKDSGKRGGVFEKIESCKKFNIPLLMIRQPKYKNEISLEEAVKIKF